MALVSIQLFLTIASLAIVSGYDGGLVEDTASWRAASLAPARFAASHRVAVGVAERDSNRGRTARDTVFSWAEAREGTWSRPSAEASPEASDSSEASSSKASGQLHVPSNRRLRSPRNARRPDPDPDPRCRLPLGNASSEENPRSAPNPAIPS